MKILIGEKEFEGIQAMPGGSTLALILKDEGEVFQEIATLLPTLASAQIKVYGVGDEADVVVAIYQNHAFYNILRSTAGDSKTITINTQVEPIEVTEADKLKERISNQNSTIEQQALKISQQKETIDAQQKKLEEQDKTNTLLTAQIKSVTDRADFVDDCIAEMATIVYA